MGQLQQIEKYLVKERPTTFAQCIEWARLQYEQDYVNEIKQLLFNLPKDQVCLLSQQRADSDRSTRMVCRSGLDPSARLMH